MLAQNFQSPAALGITDEEQDALVRVLGMLERGEIPERLFDMGTPGNPQDWTEYDCGSPCCVVGWARYVARDRIFCRVHDASLGLRRLFAMWLDYDENFGALGVSPYAATTAQAALALRSYLTTGEPRWDEALAA